MQVAEFYDIIRESLIVTLKVVAPVLLVGMVVGLIISLLQALTQIQEMTLSFVPKILAVFGALLVFGPFMASMLQGFTQEIFNKIVQIT
jgi:flagellar biosynthetic protein FliQ